MGVRIPPALLDRSGSSLRLLAARQRLTWASNRWVHLMFAVGGLVLALLMVKITEWVWGYFAKPKALYVDAIGITARRRG